MRWWASLCAIGVGVAVVVFDAPGAAAQDADDSDDDEDMEIVEPQKPAWQAFLAPVLSKKPGTDFLTGGMPDRLISFAGFDIWRYGLGGYTGFQWAPDGINKDGFILRVSASDNIERYTTPTRRYVTEIARGAILPGVKFRRGNFEMQWLAGLDAQADFLLINGRSVQPRARLGARFAADVWWEPTRSLMLQGALSGTMIDNAVSARAAAGWRLFDRFWIGPEVSRSTDFYSRQTRIGAHLTGLRTGDYEWTIAAGHIDDSFHRDGLYARFGVMLRPPRPAFFEN
ncbi:cellulose biosynthesis protein BcsS [Tardiphaga sp.]|uniref:cellulose biosynthesis protein BcsS n=1 Tax=Tardiphaga sp. TaxID=1926292 RepID=UPI00260211C7|nr:cellulose biosynthesis protein BcsS [Tardiphaga sp.]MDB5616867.1 hypothetical protein [Tardiphaga sp.]